jgi:hypothetical protein
MYSIVFRGSDVSVCETTYVVTVPYSVAVTCIVSEKVRTQVTVLYSVAVTCTTSEKVRTQVTVLYSVAVTCTVSVTLF